MSKLHSLKKEQKAVNRLIRAYNKHLIEDCFAGRFTVKQVGRRANMDKTWPQGTPSAMPLYERNRSIDPMWAGYTKYAIQVLDNEQPERNVIVWYRYVNNNLIYGYSYNFENCMTKTKDHWQSCYGLNPIEDLDYTLNEFIQQSDFWEKWHSDLAYKKEHWYTSEMGLQWMGTFEDWYERHESSNN